MNPVHRGKKVIGFAFVIFLGACAAPTTQRGSINDAEVALEAEKQREYALRQFVNNQGRLYTVGGPILEAGLPLCMDRRDWSIGAFVVNKHDFPENMRETAITTYGLGDALQVLLVFEDQPAARAGLKKGDVIVAVNGKEAPVGPEASTSLDRMLEEEIGEKGADFTLKINRGGQSEQVTIDPVERCDYPLMLSESNEINAFADGNAIYITQGMMDFTNNNDELALVIAHELAHNNMRHISSKRLNAVGGFLVDLFVAALTGVNTQGAFTKAAANAYSQEFEQEADYVGLYMMARAGRDIEDAPLFWRRMGARNPDSIEKDFLGTHPSSPERFVLLEETIEEIKMKQSNDEDLMPNIEESEINEREAPPEKEPQHSL